MLTLMCIGLAWGCAVAWRGPRAWPDADPIGDWTEVLVDLAVTCREDAQAERQRAMADARKAARAVRFARRVGAAAAGRAAFEAYGRAQAMADHWAILACELPPRSDVATWGDAWGLPCIAS